MPDFTTTFAVCICVGMVSALPFGPMGLLSLRRTLEHGLFGSYRAVLGIACADAIWAFVTVNGLSVLTDWFARQQLLLHLVAGLVFIAMGLHAILSQQRLSTPVEKSADALAGFLPNFFVVFLNPSTPLFFSIVFALLGVPYIEGGIGMSSLVGIAVLLGVNTFWIVIELLMRRYRARMTRDHVRLIARCIAIVIILLGLLILVRLLR